MNHYEHHAKSLALVAAKGDFEMAYHQALGTIKSLCNDFEDLQSRNRRYKTHEVMGVELHIKYTIEPQELGFGETPDYPAELGQCRIWVVGQDSELKTGALHDAAIEMLEAEVADDAVYV
jgi:hypothetical protein